LYNNIDDKDKEFDGSFYDENYFEHGPESGKGWLRDYHWMPRRTFKEAFAFIDTLGLDETSYVLEVGTAKGFLIRAFRELEIKADGCDISGYSLKFAPDGCWNCTDEKSWDEHANFGYTHIAIKDMLEHLTKKQLPRMLNNFSKVANKMMCVIPMGDGNKYEILEYECEVSHIIKENMQWWKDIFEINGWKVIEDYDNIKGLKDNWYKINKNGNHVFVLEKIS
jgi:hypothetical protein